MVRFFSLGTEFCRIAFSAAWRVSEVYWMVTCDEAAESDTAAICEATSLNNRNVLLLGLFSSC